MMLFKKRGQTRLAELERMESVARELLLAELQKEPQLIDSDVIDMCHYHIDRAEEARRKRK